MVRGMSRSNMMYIIMDLIREGAIGVEELADFSEGLQGTIKALTERGVLCL